MSLTLSPSGTIGFERPLTRLVPQVLNVYNPNAEKAVMKIKTTAPRSYSVRPNAAEIGPGETVEVHIVLQPLPEEPPAGAKNRDKFLVQSALFTPKLQALGIHNVWSAIPSEEVTEQKVRVAWLGDVPAPGVGGATGGAASGPATSQGAGNGLGAPLPAGVSGAALGGAGGAALGSGAGAGADRSLGGAAPGAPDVSATSATTAGLPGFSASDAARASALQEKPLGGTGSDAEAYARISQLQRQLAAAQAQKGVPVQTTAIIAALVFFLTYLFL